MSDTNPPARNTRAAAAAAAADSAQDQSPWARDIQTAVNTLRGEVDSRFGSVEQRMDQTNTQLASIKSDAAIQYQALVDLITKQNSQSSSTSGASPSTTIPSVVPVAAPVPHTTVLPHLLPVATSDSPRPGSRSAPPTAGVDSAPWSRGPAFKNLPAEDAPAPVLGLQLPDTQYGSSNLSGEALPFSTVPGGIPKGYTIKTSDIGTFNGTPEDLELFLARVQALNDSESDANWRKAMLRAMPLLLRGYAASWHQTLEPGRRATLTSPVLGKKSHIYESYI
ncbi:hypothetical protein CF326_g9167 [Tilletia indica]|nr:hypothetical protein CF326_g9167 [Tilletia indica]